MPKLVTLSVFFPAANSSSAVWDHPSAHHESSNAAASFFILPPRKGVLAADVGRNRPCLDPGAHREHHFALHANVAVVAARLAGAARFRAAAAHGDERAHAFLRVTLRVAILGELAGIVPV